MMKLLISLCLLHISLSFSAHASRSELSRYRLIHDRLSIDRYLKYQNLFSEKIFSLDIAGSSGLKDLLGDISTATDTGSSSEKQVEVTQILIKNANTEKFLNARIDFEGPIPTLTLKGTQLFPQVFVTADVGMSFSVSNVDNPASPEASLYAKKDIASGFNLWFEPQKGETWKTSLYYLQRADIEETVSASDIANDGNIIEVSELDLNEATIRADIGFHKNKATYYYLLEIREISLKRISDYKSSFDRSAFFHANYTWKNETRFFNFSPFVGVHYRNKDALSEGLYVGTHLSFSESPFSIMTKLNQDFLTLTPRYEHGFLHFSYALKSPIRNPQDDLWVSAIHNINLSVLF